MRKYREYIPMTVAGLLIAIVFAVQWPLYWTAYLRGDEHSFIYEYQLHHPWTEFWTAENKLGYGALFWFVISVLKQIFADKTVEVFRALLLFAYLGFAVDIFRSTREKTRWLVLFMVLASPCFWWYGKIIGVELSSSLLGAWSTLWIQNHPSRKKYFLGWVGLGVAVGLKPLNLVFLIYNLALYAKFNQKAEEAKGIFIALGLGFLITNPFILTRPGLYLEVLSSARQTIPFTWLNAERVLFQDAWTYDLVYSGSFFRWMFEPLAFLGIFLLLAGFVPIGKTCAWILTLVASLYLVGTTETFYGWYWFPVYYLTILALRDAQLNNIVAKILALGIVAGQLYITVPLAIDQIVLRRDYMRDYAQLPDLRTCIDDTFAEALEKAGTIIHYSLVEPAQIAQPPYQTTKKIFSEHAAFTFLSRPKTERNLPRPVFLALSDAFVSHGELAPWAVHQKVVEEEHDWSFKILGRCGTTTIFWSE